ncbi:MAG: hypothetical protein L3J76_05775, partial [Candidatus Hydrothermae bacterium]|nr:hypothetical protein [Candidatus Hydrothermae bacterium]
MDASLFTSITGAKPLVFIILTGVFGGGAAWLSGRALALKWRPVWQLVVYTALLAAAVRFLHYALFGEVLLSLQYYLVAYAVLLGLGLLGYRATRVKQMTTQYYWLYERAGPLAWR